MRNILLFFLGVFLFWSCDKEYGDIDSKVNNSPTQCNQEMINISDYFNNNPYINQLIFDKDNNMWVATTQGLLEIKNDNSYIVYNTLNTILTDNYIYTISKDYDGNIWISSRYDLYKINPETNEWTKFNSSINSLFNYYYSGDIYIASDSNIYTTTNNAVLKYENNTWIQIISNPISGFFQSSGHCLVKQDSIFWITTSKGLLKYINDSNYTLYSTDNSGISDNDIRYVYIDNTGKKWIKTDSGVETFDDQNWHLYDSYNNVIAKNNIILVNPYNSSFPYTFKHGYWFPVQPTCSSYLYVTDFTKDNENNIWVSSNNIIYNFKTEL